MLRFFLAISVWITTSAAVPAQPVLQYVSGKHIRTDCEAAPNLVTAYVSGVLDTTRTMMSLLSPPGELFCLPDDVSIHDVSLAVCQATMSDLTLDDVAAASIVMETTGGLWPCN